MGCSESDKMFLTMIMNYCDDISTEVEEFSLSKDKIIENAGFRAMLAFFVQQIGEAAGKLSAEFKEAHPEIEWKAIVGFRHRIVHAYGKVMPDILWDTVENNIPELRKFCAGVIGAE